MDLLALAVVIAFVAAVVTAWWTVLDRRRIASCPWPGAHRVAAMETDIYGTVLSTSVLLHLDGCPPPKPLPPAGRASPSTAAPTDPHGWVETVEPLDYAAELREKDRRLRQLEAALDGIGRNPRSPMGRTMRDGLLEQKRRTTRDIERDVERLRATFDDVVTVAEDVYLGDRLAFRAGQVVGRREWQAFEDAARSTEFALHVGYRDAGAPPCDHRGRGACDCGGMVR